MMELNKNSFFFYVLKETGGRCDPRHLNLIIEKLKEWLPHSTGFPETGYSINAYELGQREYKEFITRNLK